MATPMREGALDGGHRGKVADSRTASANFEYDDNEWDIGIGDLIIDLDADIEKTKEKAGEAGGTGPMAQPTGRAKLAVEHSATVQEKGLKMKIKRTKPGTKTSEAKHEIVKPGELNGDDKKSLLKRTSGGHRKEKTQEKEKVREKPEMNGVTPSPVVPRPVFPVSHGPGPPGPSGSLPNGASPLPGPAAPVNSNCPAGSPGPPVAASPKLEPPRLTAATPAAAASNPDERFCSSPPAKKPRSSLSESKEAVDVCVGTSVGTITEPECLGPCEPGTSVTLEGIVWHETAAGILVVNVTWRGKTYVGTLLDCTRHDWAPPRLCDSPTSDLDSRVPKGRGKRGRAGAQYPDLTNFTETRSSMHSKLRNGNGKGRSARSTTPNAGPSSPTPRGETSKKAKDSSAPQTSAPSPSAPSTAPTPVKKPKPSAPGSPPPSPVLFECPEQHCNKKYKNVNGLKYHQSHAHGATEDEDTKDGASLSETEESNVDAPSPAATPEKSPAEKTEPPGKETPAPQDPLALPEPSPELPAAPPASPPIPDSTKPVVKPGVLRFGPIPEDFSFASKSVIAPVAPQPLTQASAPQQLPIKLPQFKVKPAAALMPEDKLKDKKNSGIKKKRKSPEGSPSIICEPTFGGDSGERDDPHSPAYSDISDDAAPVLESEVADKGKGPADKKEEVGDPANPLMPPYVGLFNAPFYGQPPYLVPSVPTDCKKDQLDKNEPKASDKDVKKDGSRGEFPPKIIQHPSHFYSYGYVPGYHGGFVEPGYPVMVEEKGKDGKGHEDKSPGPAETIKASPILVPHPGKVKTESGKHSNDNHQILKESIEMKSQMGQFIYSRQPGGPTQEDLRRYLCQRGKESDQKGAKQSPPNSSPKSKDKPPSEEKKDKEIKQEGQKPTMETQGPPPPPTGQFAFIHPSYMQSPHYTALSFDPNHPMYRSMNPMLVPGPYGGGPYLGMPRYHAPPPEDLSRSQQPAKALDLLQHHASQYYSSHKIHELQERALKSPTSGKATPSRESPSAPPRPPSGPPPAPPTSAPSPLSADPKTGKLPSSENDTRSPPTQRHVHTHHHTHVGLTYPLLPGQYSAPYGAAVLASQQAAAVASVINPYQSK